MLLQQLPASSYGGGEELRPFDGRLIGRKEPVAQPATGYDE
jgi:hypothetical protein